MGTIRWAVGLSLLAASACANYQEQFERADEHYRAARYEAALTNLEDLEHDLGRFERPERARYDYMRGMSYARLNQRAEARHWLCLAREEAEDRADALTADMRTQLDRTLAEVDWVVNPSNEDHPNRPPASGSAPASDSAATPAAPRR